MAEASTRSQAWALFDEVVATAPLRQTSPWQRHRGEVTYSPDFDTLGRLLGVPVLLAATSQSGVPALALDVWTAFELRRAGFDPDRVWPRARPPRVLPAEVAQLLESLPRSLREEMARRFSTGAGGGTSTANLLGKNYVKQVDVVMSSWQTGPELMISTKRMDSSFGKNAANRVEESYGDAKNLSLRHPQAALGFLYGLRSTAFVEEPETAAWLLDLLAKLAREDDAYDAVGLVVPEWGGPPVDGDHEQPAPLTLTDRVAAEPPVGTGGDEPSGELDEAMLDLAADVPHIAVRTDLVPDELSPARFFTVMIDTVLWNTPVAMHATARQRRAAG